MVSHRQRRTNLLKGLIYDVLQPRFWASLNPFISLFLISLSLQVGGIQLWHSEAASGNIYSFRWCCCLSFFILLFLISIYSYLLSLMSLSLLFHDMYQTWYTCLCCFPKKYISSYILIAVSFIALKIWIYEYPFSTWIILLICRHEATPWQPCQPQQQAVDELIGDEQPK